MIHRESWYREALSEKQILFWEAELSRGILDNLIPWRRAVEQHFPGRLEERVQGWRSDLYWGFAGDAGVMDRRYGSGWTNWYLHGSYPGNVEFQEFQKKVREAFWRWVELATRRNTSTWIHLLEETLQERHYLLTEGLPALREHLKGQLS